MRKRSWEIICLFLASAAAVNAANFDSGAYGSWHDFFSDLYGQDENNGLTAFSVLAVPMGGRSEGMAGAFSAVCDDISFFEWNPAGSAMLNKTELAFFHNNWIADTKIESAVFSMRLARLGIAAVAKWLYTPFTEYGGWGERLSKGYYSEVAGMLNASYNFFPGYYFPGLSLGVSLKGAFRSMPEFSGSTEVSQSAAGFAADVGILTRVNFLKLYDSRDKNMSFALVLRNFGPPIMDEGMPSMAVAGFSYRPVRPFLISFDFSYPLNFVDLSLSEKPFFALGFSAMLTRFLSMRTGFQLKAGGSKFTLGSSLEIGAAALEVNYTLDLATQMQPLNRVTLGVRLDLGDGGREKQAQLVDEYYLAGLDAYSQGDDEKALDFFKAALELDPFFDPAHEGVSAVNNFRALSGRIQEIGTFD
ncbi:MAG: UPF0164 family protein [Spirochaetaceae bacterium]|jgi:hypothetical protein|nr:UPF0164 family protein [Spirochaetaceae bacterium]